MNNVSFSGISNVMTSEVPTRVKKYIFFNTNSEKKHLCGLCDGDDATTFKKILDDAAAPPTFNFVFNSKKRAWQIIVNDEKGEPTAITLNKISFFLNSKAKEIKPLINSLMKKISKATQFEDTEQKDLPTIKKYAQEILNQIN